MQKKPYRQVFKGVYVKAASRAGDIRDRPAVKTQNELGRVRPGLIREIYNEFFYYLGMRIPVMVCDSG